MKIVLAHIRLGKRSLTLLECSGGRSKCLKIQNNGEKGESKTFTTSISFWRKEMENRISKSKCIQWHSLPCCYFLFYFSLTKCKNNSPIKTGKFREKKFNLEKRKNLCNIVKPMCSALYHK